MHKYTYHVYKYSFNSNITNKKKPSFRCLVHHGNLFINLVPVNLVLLILFGHLLYLVSHFVYVYTA